MNVLVSYASRMGSTREIAERIASKLREGGLEVTTEAAERTGDIAGYDAFVVGSGVYAGHWLEEATDFVWRNRTILAERPVWLFSSGPVGTSATTHAPTDPKEIAEVVGAIDPRGIVVFAGALDRHLLDESGLGRAERFVAKRFVPEGDFRDWDKIEAWAGDIARALVPAPLPAR